MVFKVQVDPGFWEGFAEAPPEVQEKVREIIAAMHQAAEEAGPNATEEEFNTALERITGSKVLPATAEQIESVESRKPKPRH